MPNRHSLAVVAWMVTSAFAAGCEPYPGSSPPTDPPRAVDAEDAPGPMERLIQINGAPLDEAGAETLAALEAAYGTTLPDGAYWYDPVSGAFGAWGEPGSAVIPAGLDLGPPLPADASNGTSGVVLNNRELQDVEVAYLSLLVGVPWQPGRYFVDAQGNAGLEGGPVLVNLVQAATVARGSSSGSDGSTFITGSSGGSKSYFYSEGGCHTLTTSSGTTFAGNC